MDKHAASIKHLKRDKLLGTFIRNYGPLKFRRTHSGGAFQALAESIVYQQISGKAGDSILKKFVGLWPTKKFPTPEDVRKAKPELLRSAGLSGQKAAYIKDLAEKFLDGTIDPKQFHRLSDAEIVSHVSAVKGVGTWTAQMFLMFTLGRPDVLPTGDLGIQKAFQKVFRLKKLPNPRQMEQLAECWAGHRTVACFYLWRTLDKK